PGVIDPEHDAQHDGIEHGRRIDRLPEEQKGLVSDDGLRHLPVQQLVAEDPRLGDGQRDQPAEAGAAQPEAQQTHCDHPRFSGLSPSCAPVRLPATSPGSDCGERWDRNTPKPMIMCSIFSSRKSAERARARSAPYPKAPSTAMSTASRTPTPAKLIGAVWRIAIRPIAATSAAAGTVTSTARNSSQRRTMVEVREPRVAISSRAS